MNMAVVMTWVSKECEAFSKSLPQAVEVEHGHNDCNHKHYYYYSWTNIIYTG